MKVISFICIALLVMGCNEGEEFIQKTCDITDHGVLWISFSNDDASRNVSVSPDAKSMTFKGTTFKDMKWASNIEDGDYFSVDETGVLTITFKAGKEYRLGVVKDNCKQVIQRHLGSMYK